MWKLETSERLRHWRYFRTTLDSMTIEEAYTAVHDYWNSCPFSGYYLDEKDIKTWPNPWQLIEDNCYCELAKCLGIVYTIALSCHGTVATPEIRIYEEPDSGLRYYLAVFENGKYCINFSNDGPVNTNSIPKELQLLARYSSSDLGLDRL